MYPDPHSCMQYNFCTVIAFCLRDNLYRDRACTQHYYIMTPKTTPWCLAHRDNFPAKVPGLGGRMGYATNAYMLIPAGR